MEDFNEYSSTNAWLLNFANGNQNNNNKYNSYYVRAVSASQLSCSGFVLSDNQRNELDTEFRLAYQAFIKGKKSSNSVAELIPNHEYKLIKLVDSIIAGTYAPEPLRVFIVFKPTVREIFESVAIDRIVDTWISFRLEPLMDKVIPRNAPACRAGYGTKEANRQLREAFEQCSENYTTDCWIMKYDVQSYYMSIDKYRLLSMIHGLVDLYYEHWDKDILKWLIAVRLMTDPRKNVIRRSPIEYWKHLPPHKSLFNHPEWQGIPIGLLLTNESANIYLAPIDHYIMNELGYKYYSRSIDDSWYMHQDKNKMLNDMALIRAKYAEFGLTVHPNKYYFQHYSKGVKILNVYQKPGRTYASNRCLTNCFKKIHWWNKQASNDVAFQIQNCEKFAATINSYLGMLQHLDEFNKRKEICDKVFSVWSKVLYPDRKNYNKMIVRRRYKTKARIKRRIRRKRKRIINYVNSIIMATKSKPVRSFGPETKAIAKEKINANQWIGRANFQDYVETIGEGDTRETRVVEGIKTWTEAIYDHEPTAAELAELANITFE